MNNSETTRLSFKRLPSAERTKRMINEIVERTLKTHSRLFFLLFQFFSRTRLWQPLCDRCNTPVSVFERFNLMQKVKRKRKPVEKHSLNEWIFLFYIFFALFLSNGFIEINVPLLRAKIPEIDGWFHIEKAIRWNVRTLKWKQCQITIIRNERKNLNQITAKKKRRENIKRNEKFLCVSATARTQ